MFIGCHDNFYPVPIPTVSETLYIGYISTTCTSIMYCLDVWSTHAHLSRLLLLLLLQPLLPPHSPSLLYFLSVNLVLLTPLLPFFSSYSFSHLLIPSSSHFTSSSFPSPPCFPHSFLFSFSSSSSHPSSSYYFSHSLLPSPIFLIFFPPAPTLLLPVSRGGPY